MLYFERKSPPPLFETVLSHTDVKLGARQSKTLGGFRLVPFRFPQNLRDCLLLDCAQIRRRLFGRVAGALKREMRRVNKAAFAENRGAFERVAQLAHIAGPVISQQRLARIAREAGRRAPE